MFKINKKLMLRDVLNKITAEFKLINEVDFVEFNNIAPLFEANEDSITFIGNEKKNKLELISLTKAKIIIMSLDENISNLKFNDKLIIDTNSPRTLLSRIAKSVVKDFRNNSNKISHNAVISPDCDIGNGTSVGTGTIIGNSKIGKRCKILNNVIIEDGCEIGDDVYIGNNSVVGSKAISIILNEEQSQGDGFPQLGGVLIESNVHIDSFSSIQRGTFGRTIIRRNVKIDSYVQIAHNVEIGENTIIFGHSKISGSVKIGENVLIGQSVTVGNIGSIGSNAYICMGSVVIYDVASSTKVFGNPAKKIISPRVEST